MTSMKSKLKVTDETARLIRHAHPELKRKLKAALQMILNDPRCGKALREELKGLNSFRVGNIRIIYSAARKNIIEIITIGPRKDIYEETYKLINRGKGQ
jgi:mRNA interferase RelE/StbE